MKYFAVLAIALCLAGANAGFIDEFKTTLHNIGDNIKNVYNGVKPVISTAFGNLLSNLKQTGAQVLAQGAQALLGSLNGGSSTSTRDVALLDKVGQFIKNGESAIESLSKTIGGLFNGALNKLTELAGKLGSKELFGQPLSKYIQDIENVVSSHNLLQNSILKQLIQEPGKFLAQAAQHLMGHKRSGITDLLSNIGQQLAATFKPAIDTVTKHITNLGTTLKNAGTALFGAVKPSIDALKGKLTDHVNTLKQVGTELVGHGKNALSALTDAVTDILGQTFKNAQPTIQKAIDTAKQAGHDTVGSILGN